jgi:hypothetical protein
MNSCTRVRTAAGFAAQLVGEHRLGKAEAIEIMHDLVVTNQRKACRL